MRKGIFLDIFPMDPVPDSAPLRGIHNFACFALRKILYAEAGRKAAPTSLLRTWYTVLNAISHKWAFQQMDRLARIPKTSCLVRHLSFPMPKGRIYGFSREWFEYTTDIKFEERAFPGMTHYHAFLTYHYGDYMQIPPPDKRHTHPVSRFKLPNMNYAV